MNKAELLSEFKAYLDAQPGNQAGITETGNPEKHNQQTDLYSLFLEMSALKNEIKTQARQFKTAIDDFREVFESLKEHQSYLEQALAKQQQQNQLIIQKIKRGFLLDLIAIRDRLLLSINSINEYHAGRLEMFFGGKKSGLPFKNTVLEGQKMILKRIDRQLKQHQVQSIQAKNKPLNPRIMKVVALDKQPQLKNGTVLEEIRTGFIVSFNGKKQLLRSAEVKVNKLEGKI